MTGNQKVIVCLLAIAAAVFVALIWIKSYRMHVVAVGDRKAIMYDSSTGTSWDMDATNSVWMVCPRQVPTMENAHFDGGTDGVDH